MIYDDDKPEPRLVLGPSILVAFIAALTFGIAAINSAWIIAFSALAVQCIVSLSLPYYRLTLADFWNQFNQEYSDTSYNEFPPLHLGFLWFGFAIMYIVQVFMYLNEDLYENPYEYWKNKRIKKRVARLHTGNEEAQLQATINKLEEFTSDLKVQIEATRDDDERGILMDHKAQADISLKKLRSQQFALRSAQLKEDAQQTLATLNYRIDAEDEVQKINNV